MSYDMSIGEEDFNYTYNVAPMWYAALPEFGIRSHHGMSGKQALKPLLYIYKYMILNKASLIEMNPENGWGDYYGAMTFVHELIQASLRNPDEIWEGD